MVVEGRVTAEVFESFLRRLLEGMDRKIFLIVDGHPVHRARRVRAFVEAHRDRLELFHLPPYAPELNPDELAWAHLKRRLGRRPVRDRHELVRAVRRILRSMQRVPALIRSFFRAPTCAYTLAETWLC